MPRPDSPTVRRSALERRITRAAVERGTTPARLRRLIGFTVLCEVLAEAQYRGILPLFFIKGGVAIELRLGLVSRATRDIDIGLCAPPETLIPVLDEALAIGFDDFHLRRRSAARVLENGIHRLEIALDYLDRPWATIAVDLGPATEDSETDVVPPLDLRDIELATEHAVPCLGVHEQIAQKMHALTEPTPYGQPNPRARDVLDILLLIDHLAIKLDDVRIACERIFAGRATHPWPVHVFTFPPSWSAILAQIAREIGYDTDQSSVIQRRFNDLLGRLSEAPALPN